MCSRIGSNMREILCRIDIFRSLNDSLSPKFGLCNQATNQVACTVVWTLRSVHFDSNVQKEFNLQLLSFVLQKRAGECLGFYHGFVNL